MPDEICPVPTTRAKAVIIAVIATITVSSIATSKAASTRGATSRWTGEMPMTISASVSSRTVRAPRSEQIARVGLVCSPADASQLGVLGRCCIRTSLSNMVSSDANS